ncbi:LSM domain-containing protein [Heterostelium album PN500]|uniref:U6 snRNA-associated Sm-like protein LSm4 n=1 Tax=Heterostelium pallidum (strain ATCC 26659 / Pp 5 / PN500) TaxID=670386 RepID=D3BT12_HETP5|nr:LSM domain-containing protein [Heterostelium album PN500]EFA75627.1 LSM domain-containing protein [Heterostelium album PN500]|eukprot:XP_020427761.1 LSM domain-containing protein [Heterostelium album PN500]
MLPLSLLRTGQGHQIMVELKNGETFNGYLVNCDNWMNINLKNVIRTSKDSDKFWKLQSCYIRGNTIKYISVPDEIIDMVVEEEQVVKQHQPASSAGRGDSSSRGRGRGRGDGSGGRGRGDGSSSRGRGDGSVGRGRGEYRGRGRGDGSVGRGRGVHT